MDEYLAFVDYIGRTIDGQYIYRFDFTVDSDSVWGDYFNVTPAGIVPDLQPDRNSLSKTCKVNFPKEMQIAKKNYCFSMQDCIDGIIPLCFSEIDDDTILFKDKPLKFRFGEKREVVEMKIAECGLDNLGFEEIKRNDENLVNDLIDNLNNNSDDDLDPDEF